MYASHVNKRKLRIDLDRLSRAFVLIDTMHGLKRSDEALLQALRENAVSHQVVLSKADRLLFPNNRKASKLLLERHAEVLRQKVGSIRSYLDAMDIHGPKALGEILACSTTASLERGKFLGINNLRWSILAATGLHEVRRQPPAVTSTLVSLTPKPAPGDVRF